VNEAERGQILSEDLGVSLSVTFRQRAILVRSSLHYSHRKDKRAKYRNFTNKEMSFRLLGSMRHKKIHELLEDYNYFVLQTQHGLLPLAIVWLWTIVWLFTATKYGTHK
jgi:hypothetical protein